MRQTRENICESAIKCRNAEGTARTDHVSYRGSYMTVARTKIERSISLNGVNGVESGCRAWYAGGR